MASDSESACHPVVYLGLQLVLRVPTMLCRAGFQRNWMESDRFQLKSWLCHLALWGSCHFYFAFFFFSVLFFPDGGAMKASHMELLQGRLLRWCVTSLKSRSPTTRDGDNSGLAFLQTASLKCPHFQPLGCRNNTLEDPLSLQSQGPTYPLLHSYYRLSSTPGH